MSRRRVSNPLALAVLGCLIERPMHPYEISSTLRSRGKEQSIKLNYGSLYSVVEALHRHGFVVPLETQRSGRRPERTTYAVTDAGIAEFEDWLSELISEPKKEYPALEAALSLMPGLHPDEAARLLELRATRLDLSLRQLKAAQDLTAEMGLPRLFGVENEFRAAMLAAERDFVRGLAEEIRSEALPGVATWRRIYELREQGVNMTEIFTEPAKYFSEEEARFLSEGRPADRRA